MTATPGIFEVLASDQHDARVASRKALVLSRDRLDARLGKFLAASRSPEEFDARYDLVSDDFAGIVRVAANEVGHDETDSLIETLHSHYRAAGKPPWLEESDSDEENDEETEEPKSKKDKKKDKKKKDEDSDDEGDDSLEFAAKTAGAAPFVDRQSSLPWQDSDEDTLACPNCDGTGEKGENKCTECSGSGRVEKPSDSKDSSVHVADKGNTGLAGPSPKMDKKRWTPKSVKPIDVPSERHPTVQKDVTEVMPKENEGPPGDAHNLEEIWSLTTTETLPTGKGLDDAGFAGNNQDMAPHTKTFGDGGQTDPVKSESLEA